MVLANPRNAWRSESLNEQRWYRWYYRCYRYYRCYY